MTKEQKAQFTAELEKLEAEFDERKSKLFEGGPAMASTIQHIATKKLLTLLCRIMLSM